jgi:hypothetical protein
VPVGDLRTRLRCERVGVSRPDDLCHLKGRMWGEAGKLMSVGGDRLWDGDMYFSAEVMCRGSGMSTAHACTCIGHQETRGEARDMLTCTDRL